MNVYFYSLYCFIIGIFQITKTKFHKNITNILTLIDILVSFIYLLYFQCQFNRCKFAPSSSVRANQEIGAPTACRPCQSMSSTFGGTCILTLAFITATFVGTCIPILVPEQILEYGRYLKLRFDISNILLLKFILYFRVGLWLLPSSQHCEINIKSQADQGFLYSSPQQLNYGNQNRERGDTIHRNQSS